MPILSRRAISVVFAVFSALAIGAFSALPWLIQHLAVAAFQQHGLTARIDNIDINPLTGELVVEGLTLHRNKEQMLRLERLAINIAMSKLPRQQLVIERLLLSNFHFELEQRAEGIRIAGIALPSSGASGNGKTSPAGDWHFAVEQMEIYGGLLRYRLHAETGEIKISHLKLEQLSSWQPTPASLQASISLNAAPLSINGQLQPFTASPRAKLELRLQNLDLGKTASLFSKTKSIAGFLDAEQTLSLEKTGHQLDVSAIGWLSLTTPSAQHEGWRINATALDWQGSLGFNSGRHGQQINLDGQLSGDSLQAIGPLQRLEFEHVHAQALIHAIWQQARLSQLTGNARIELDNARISDKPGHTLLAAWRKLHIEDIAIASPTTLRAGNLHLEAMQALRALDGEAQPALLRLATARLQDIRFDTDEGLAIAHARLEGMRGELIRQSQGRWQSALPGGQPLPGGPTARQGPAAKAALPPLTVARLEIGAGSEIRFTDHSVMPSFGMRLHDITLSLEQLDTRGAPLRLHAQSRVDDYGSLELSGSLSPFGESISAALNSQLKSISLASLSPYTAQHLGYVLKRGQMDAAIRLNIEANQIDAQAQLILRKLQLAARDSSEGRQFSDQLALPLDKTLDLLRDSNDTIALTLPISGRLDDPQFHFAQIINKASAKALKIATIQYLKMTLQPWGTLYSVAQLASKAAAQAALDPFMFAPGSTTLADEQHNYLAKLARLLRERPRLTLSFCGLATGKDRQWLSQAENLEITPDGRATRETVDRLKSLAKQRALGIKNLLLERHGIAEQRLLICHPQILPDDEPPRVDVVL